MPEWSLSGGIFGGGWVYEHERGARAFVHVNDDGDLDVATWDPVSGDERAFPHREALEEIVHMDVERMRQSGSGEDHAMLALCGIGDFASVRSYRGRKKRWDRVTLACFVNDVVEHGMPWATKQWGLKKRQGLAVMRMAEDAGLGRIEKTGGERSPNIYSRCDDGIVSGDTAHARGDWHRRSWFVMERKRRELQSNWERQRVEPQTRDAE